MLDGSCCPEIPEMYWLAKDSGNQGSIDPPSPTTVAATVSFGVAFGFRSAF